MEYAHTIVCFQGTFGVCVLPAQVLFVANQKVVGDLPDCEHKKTLGVLVCYAFFYKKSQILQLS